MKRATDRTSRRSLITVSLTAGGIVLVIWLAYWSSSNRPPSASQAALLTVLSATAQILSSVIAASGNRADPNFVKSAIARLVSIGLKVQICEKEVQRVFERGTSSEKLITLGQVSLTMSYLQEETSSAIQDWKNQHPDVVEALIERAADPQTIPTPTAETANV